MSVVIRIPAAPTAPSHGRRHHRFVRRVPRVAQRIDRRAGLGEELDLRGFTYRIHRGVVPCVPAERRTSP